MAERSIIDGFGPGVQKWASEETAKKIADTLASIQSLSSKQTKEIVKTLEKSGGMLDKEALKDLEESLQDLEEAVEDQTEATEEHTTSQRKATSASTIFKNTLISTGAIIGSAMGAVFGQMMNQANIVAELNRNGVQLANGLDGTATGLSNFGLAAAEANLSFQELADITKTYGATINKFGIRAFAQTSKSVTQDLEALGISSAESSELVAEYLKARRFMTYQETLTQQQQNNAAKAFIKQIDQYSMAFGESRTALMESVTGTLEQIDVQAFLKTQGPGVRAAFEDMAAQLAGSEFAGLRTSLTQAIADPVTQRSELFMDLINAGQADAANALLAFSEAARSGDTALSNVRFEEFMTSLQQANIELSQRIGAEGQALRDFSNQAKLRADLMARGNDFERQSAARITEMQNSFRNISMFFQRVAGSVLGDSDVVETINATLSEMSDFLESDEGKGAIKSLQESFASMIRSLTPALKAAIPLMTSVFDTLTGWAENIESWTANFESTIRGFDFSNIPSIIGTGIMAALGAGALVAVLSGVLASGIGNLLSKVAFGKSGSGGIFGNMFKGIGRGIGGILQGLALGLTAFGKAGPSVLKGAVILAAVIPIIGAGIAGATWIMGKALPTFAEGLKSFESIDGDNLAKVGDGTMKLGAGLAAMAAGNFLDFFADMGTAIFEFFGGERKGPIEMLQGFANAADSVGPGLTTLGEALGAFAPQMVSLSNSIGNFSDVDIDDVVEGFEDLLDLDFDDSSDIAMFARNLEPLSRIDGQRLLASGEGLERLAEALETLSDIDFGDEISDSIEEIADINFEPLLRMSSISETVGPSLQALGNYMTAFVTELTRFADSMVRLDDADIEDTVESILDLSNVDPLTDIIALPSIEIDDSNIDYETIDRELQAMISTLLPASLSRDITVDIGVETSNERIRTSTEELAELITRYFDELKRLEGIKPISISTEIEDFRPADFSNEVEQVEQARTRVENSPLLDDRQETVRTPTRPIYQSVEYTQVPLRVAEPEIPEREEPNDPTDNPNPEISNTNVARRVPEGEGEINTLIKEQNKMIGNLLIAMDTNNRRLKSLVRINEEKGA